MSLKDKQNRGFGLSFIIAAAAATVVVVTFGKADFS